MRPSHSSFWCPAVGLALALAAAPTPALAQAPAAPAAAPAPLSASLTGMARAEYEAGKLLYQDGDFQNALIKFQRVYELSHDGRLLWNIAVCEKNLRRYTRVLTTLDRYLAEAGKVISAEDRQEAKDLAAAARPLVSALRITVTEPGAAIVIDDVSVGTSPLAAAVSLDVGTRRIHIQKAGYKPFDRPLEVPGGTEMTLTAALEKEVHQGRVTVAAGAADLISIDGRAMAQGKWDGQLSSGGHTLRVTSPGMTIYQSEVVVQDDKSREIQVTLTPLPKASSTSKWLWIAGGAALVAGAVVTGAVLYKPTQRPAVDGTLGTFPLSHGGFR
ncbi:MAG: PEGA domain-containing protein [Byssovorax sp.]